MFWIKVFLNSNAYKKLNDEVKALVKNTQICFCK